MKIVTYNANGSTYLEAILDADDHRTSNSLEGSGVEITLNTPLVFFDQVFDQIHPDVLGAICLAIFYPFIGKRVEFPHPVSPRLVNSMNREIFTKTKIIEVMNVDANLAKYSGDGSSCIAFGGGVDSSAIRALFPEAHVVHEASINSGKPVIDKTNGIIKRMGDKATLVTTNQRFLSKPSGWHVWIASAVTAALVACKRNASYVMTGTNLGSSFLQNGTKYFDKHAGRKWHGISGNYWEQIFWDVGLPVFSPISGLSEILNLDISYKSLNKEDVIYCNQKEGGNCDWCAKCFRRKCVEDYLGYSDVDYDAFKTKGVLSVIQKKPTYFGHLYAAMLNDGWQPPGWVLECFTHLPKGIKFPLRLNKESLDLVPIELKGYIAGRLESYASSMSDEDINQMKGWDQKTIPMKKYVLCRPRGGLNDMLCQIQLCWDYAKKFDRTLVINTDNSGFLDSFENYFVLKGSTEVDVVFDFPIGADLTKASCVPNELFSHIDDYKAVWISGGGFVDQASNVKVTFDFTEDYSESVLIHEQCGGGNNSIDVLANFVLSSDLAKIALDKIETLGTYQSIHVRNTDYKTEYESFFNEIDSSSGEEKLVLCTDDYACQSYAVKFFRERLMLSSNIPDLNGKSLHANMKINRLQANYDSIIDLLVLASGTKLHTTNLTGGFKSGFSRLAEHLQARKDIIEQLLSTNKI
jgi:hypothetical protein